MNCEFKAKKLSLLADIQTGPFGSQLHKEDYVDSGTPIVTVEHLGNKKFSMQNLPFVSDRDKERLKKFILSEGDIVFSRVGSVDRCSFVSEEYDGWMFSGRCLRVRPYDEINPEYLYYYFTLENTKQFVRGIATGATMPSINTKFMGEVPIMYPSKDIQERIAKLLGVIDYKINVNNSINDNLSDQIQAIYSNEFDPTTHTPSGILADICHYSSDRIPVSELSLSTYYSTENMQPNKMGSVDATNLPSITQTTGCHKGDVLISNIRPYFKKIVYVTDDSCGCSTDVLCFVPKEDQYSAFLFGTLYMDRFFDYMVAGSKGTKMPRGDKQQIMNYPIVLPDKESLDLFNGLIVPMLDQIAANRIESSRLTTIRDTMLPKLMSGELDVSTLDI